MKSRRSEGEPQDRLTRLGDEMLSLAYQRGGERLRAIILLFEGDRGGIALGGYDNDAEAIVDLLEHLRAIFEANGQSLKVVPMARPPGEG